MRKNKKGLVTSFIVHNPVSGKNERVQLSKGVSLAEAKFIKDQKKAQWKEHYKKTSESVHFIGKFKKIQNLVESFELHRKTLGIKRVEHELSYLKIHTLKYFLDEIKEQNVGNWYFHYKDFLTWLGPRLKSKNSINNVIVATNAFLGFYEEETHQDIPLRRMKKISDRLIPKAGDEAYLSKIQFDELLNKLVLNSATPEVIMLAKLQYHCGLRASEALAIDLNSDVMFSRPEIKTHICQKLDASNITFYGFLRVSKQKDKSGKLVPLKGKNVINLKNTRFTPILDKDFAQELVESTLDLSKVKYSEYSKLMRLVGFKSHHLRHTAISNWFVLLGGAVDLVFSKDVWGHSRENMFDRYVHLIEKFRPKEIKPKTIQKL